MSSIHYVHLHSLHIASGLQHNFDVI